MLHVSEERFDMDICVLDRFIQDEGVVGGQQIAIRAAALQDLRTQFLKIDITRL